MPRIPVFPLCTVVLVFSAAGLLNAQQPAEAPPQQQPQVRVNMLNVCTPSAEEQKEIASALARVPREPLFGTDFEVSRGRSTLTEMPSFIPVGQRTNVSDEAPVASYVRMRREFSVQALFSSVQYSFSDDGQMMVETLVFHVRDPKDLIEVSLEDSASSVTNAASMLAANTPVSRVRLERFGKSSIALARCSATANGPAPDQSAYEPLFQSASSVLTNYRGLLHVKAIVPDEMAKIGATRSKPRTSAKAKPQSQKK